MANTAPVSAWESITESITDTAPVSVWAERLARAKALIAGMDNQRTTARQCTAALQRLNAELRTINAAAVAMRTVLAKILENGEEETDD